MTLESPVSAHAFAAVYTLPVPFWMYAYAASAALVLSFLVAGLAMSSPVERAHVSAGIGNSAGPKHHHAARKLKARTVRAMQCAAVLMLGMAIGCGLIGVANPFRNLSMTLFWIGFVIALPYFTLLAGDIFVFCNPWRVLARCLRLGGKGRAELPRGMGVYPALVFYIGFIIMELFGHASAKKLALILLGYTVITLVGVWRYGDAWFRNGELFAILLSVVGLVAPVAYRPLQSGEVEVTFRWPLSALMAQRVDVPGSVLFVLFMLSSTAFDGAHETLPWSALFWRWIYPPLEPLVKAVSVQPFAAAALLYRGWELLMLILSPLAYYAGYLGFLRIANAVAPSGRSARSLAVCFLWSLVPIAVAYHVAHYFMLLPTQGIQMARLISDPLGWGWNLLGTGAMALPDVTPASNAVWHIQVGLILVGHIASVAIAHAQALRIFPMRGRAMLSQLPMLALMVALTTSGLWILSLPIGG